VATVERKHSGMDHFTADSSADEGHEDTQEMNFTNLDNDDVCILWTICNNGSNWCNIYTVCPT